MSKENTYNIPIDLIKSTGIKVTALNESEALEKASIILNESKTVQKLFTEVKIIKDKITCDEDDEIMETVAKDFNLEIKEDETSESIIQSFFKFQVSK